MEHDERRVVEEAIFRYHADFLTSREREMRSAFLVRAKSEAYGARHLEEFIRGQMGTLEDPEIDAMLEEGFLAFRRTVVDRILQTNAMQIAYNRCPACILIVGTPQAKWCKWCKHDWQ
jgi:hypothetical protein